MSYCRWSSDDFRCDLYIYESVYDCWTIHVAGSRHVHTPPPRYTYPEEHRVYTDERKIGFSLTREGVEAWIAWEKENNPLVPLDLPHAGETFNLATPGECADKVEELVALGYSCPGHVISTLREEQVELDASVDTRPKDEDPAQTGASLASGAVPAEERGDALTPQSHPDTPGDRSKEA